MKKTCLAGVEQNGNEKWWKGEERQVKDQRESFKKGLVKWRMGIGVSVCSRMEDVAAVSWRKELVL